jgi:hypothetical protein
MSILVFDNRSNKTPMANLNRLLAALKTKSHPTGAVIPQAGTKLSKLFAEGKIQKESSDRGRWSADRMDTDDVSAGPQVTLSSSSSDKNCTN